MIGQTISHYRMVLEGQTLKHLLRHVSSTFCIAPMELLDERKVKQRLSGKTLPLFRQARGARDRPE
jgi:hypothetical protein